MKQTNNCDKCKQSTKWMYKMSRGTFCEDCKFVEYRKQEIEVWEKDFIKRYNFSKQPLLTNKSL